MNTSDAQWLEKLFEQHREDQKEYQDAKFDSVEEKIAEVKETVDEIVTARIEDTRNCADCKLCLERKINNVDAESKKRDNNSEKKILIGGVLGIVALMILTYGVYGGNIAYLVGQLLVLIP